MTPIEPVANPAIELARVAATGDAAATSRLLKLVAPRVVRVVRAILGGGHADVDDVAQQALIGFVQALPAFRGDCDPSRYATTIAVRTAIASRRKQRVDMGRRDDTETDMLAEPSPGPSEELAAQQRKALMRDLLAKLAPEQAEALAMRVVLGWSLEEIAAESGAPLNTVRSRLRLAKEGLRKAIEQNPRIAAELDVEVDR